MRRLKNHSILLYLVCDVVWCGAAQCRQVSYDVESMGHSLFNVSVFINTFFLYVAINTVLHILYT
jgi:hypothetical protein